MVTARPSRPALTALAWGLTVAYLLAIYALSSMSHPPGAANIGRYDKLVHAMVFGGLSFLVGMSTRKTFPTADAKWAAIAGFLAATLYGATDEVHQRSTPGRSSDVWDAVADAVGAGLLASVLYVGLKRFEAQSGEG